MGRRLRWGVVTERTFVRGGRSGWVGVRAFGVFRAFGAWYCVRTWAVKGRVGSSGLPAERHGHAVYDEAREDLCDDGHPALAHDEAREVVLARRAHLPRREERAAVEALRVVR